MKKTLFWNNIYKLGKFNNDNCWFPHRQYSEYFTTIKMLTSEQPNTYARAAFAHKFASWLLKYHIDMAINLELESDFTLEPKYGT